jgi:DNA repair photolyase
MKRIRIVAGTECIEIVAKSVLNRVAGMPFGWSINPYRGCQHDCVFCYARRTHWFAGRDGVGEWARRISVKVNAPAILRAELARPSWRGEEVALGTSTDPYQPLEGTYRITRGILTELVRARTPAGIVTRSPLIVRDADLLMELARVAGVDVCVSIPTLDAAVAREIEPAVAPPAKRLFAVQSLAARGIRVGIAVAPVLPGITDDEATIERVVRAARDCGASFVWHSVLNLGDVTRDSFFRFLDARRPHEVARYAELFARGRYANPRYVRDVGARFRALRERLPLAPGPVISALPDPQLRLVDQPAQEPGLKVVRGGLR